MNADSSGDLARVAAGLRNEIRSKVNALRVQLTDELRRIDKTVEKRAKETAARLDAADARVDTVAADHAVLRQHVERRMRDLMLRAGRLEGEIQQIEGLLRHRQGQVPVDLDDVPAGLRPVVDAVRAAERIRATLLDDDARAARRLEIERCEQCERTLAETRQRALAASRALAVRTAGGWAFRKAVTAYRTERGRMSRLEAELATAREKSDAAEQDLRRDAAQQQAHRAHPGAAAADRLAGHVRDRIDEAFAEYHLFPPWFTTVLGHRPPPTRAAQWREAAVRVVLYRITYEVTDRVLALGPPPSGGHRGAEYDAVQAALRGLEE